MDERALDFFVSYNNNPQDIAWAQWIGKTLEEQGKSVFLQAWDIRPGQNLLAEMQKAAGRCRHMLGVLSPDALEAPFVQQEWFSALVTDPLGQGRRFIPVRVRACEPTGLLQPIVYLDLVGRDAEQARAALLALFDGERRPREIPFPGAPPPPRAAPAPFPGAAAAPSPEAGVPVFIGVMREDLEFATTLCVHLFPATQAGALRVWHRGLLRGGDEDALTAARLDEARIIALLVSPALVGTPEGAALIKRALARRGDGVRVVPVLVRTANWRATALSAFKPLPPGEQPIGELRSRDSGYVEVAQALTALAQTLA